MLVEVCSADDNARRAAQSSTIVLQQSIGNIAEQLARDIETNNPGEKGVWTKAAKELRFPWVLSHS
jgi:hypothetical protein